MSLTASDKSRAFIKALCVADFSPSVNMRDSASAVQSSKACRLGSVSAPTIATPRSAHSRHSINKDISRNRRVALAAIRSLSTDASSDENANSSAVLMFETASSRSTSYPDDDWVREESSSMSIAIIIGVANGDCVGLSAFDQVMTQPRARGVEQTIAQIGTVHDHRYQRFCY